MVSMDWLLRHRRTKVAETDRLIPNDAGACPLLYPRHGRVPTLAGFRCHSIYCFLMLPCRCWFLLCVFFTLFTGTYGHAWAMDAITVQLKWKHQFQFAGYYAALHHGFYADEGLNVMLVEGGMEHPPVDELLAGHAQYAVADAGALLYRAKGRPVVVLATIFQHSPQVILVRKDSGIETPADLRGKRGMLQQGYLTVEVLSMLHHFGVHQFTRQPSTYDIGALIDGRTDAFPAYSTNEPFLMGERSIPFNMFRPLDYGIDFYGDTLVTTESELQHHPARAAAFRRATIKGWEYALTHTDEIIELILRKYNTQHKSRSHLVFEAQAISDLIPTDLVPIGFSNPVRWQHIADTFTAEGLMQPGFSLKGFLYKPAPDVTGMILRYKWQVGVAGLLIIILLLVLYAHQFRRYVVRLDAEHCKLRKLVEAQPIPAVISRKKDGLILFHNRIVMTVMGFPENIDTMYTSDFYFELQDRERMLNLLHEDGGFYNVELKLKKVDGTPIWALLSAQPMEFEGEDVFYVTFIDITARRHAEMALQQSQKMEAMGVLVGGVAHDFNNALAGLRVNSFIISDDESRLSDDAKHALKKNMELISYSKNIIRKLLMVADKGETRKQMFSLSAVLNGMSDMIRMSVPESVVVTMDIPEDDIMIAGDRTQIQQIVINLVNNARDAVVLVDQAHIHITPGITSPEDAVYAMHPEAEGSHVWLRIEDNGHGISDENTGHIFEPFFSSKSMHEGAGLGLATVYNIVKNHKGFIDVKREQGSGTVMTVYFPRCVEEMPPHAEREAVFSLIHGHGETILIVDDDAGLLESLAVTLKRIGYHTLQASDGSQAWIILREHKEQISLVILDAIMPKMNGIDVARKMRQADMNMPVIFVTAYDFTHALHDSTMPENCIVLSKPYDVSRLSHEMRYMMDSDVAIPETE